jgi:hypothetical protein
VPRDWCDDMAEWMRGRMAGGPMMGAAMWGDAARMRATCREWTANAPANAHTAEWCDAMVDWMGRNGTGNRGAGNGPGWMMPGGSMMGG